MRIGIDARFLGPQGTGIGRYVHRLVENLQDLDKTNHYVIFLRKSNWHLFEPTAPNFEKVLTDAHWYTLKEQFVMTFAASRAKLDLFHIPHFNIPIFYKGDMVVTIHDLIKSDYHSASSTTRSPLIYGIKHKIYEKVIETAVKRSKAIITPSDYVKKKIQSTYAASKGKVYVTHEAADDKFFEWGEKKLSEGAVKQVMYRYNIREPYIIYVGNAFPYKNIDSVLEALTYLDPNIKFINPCVRSAFYERLAEKVHRLGLEHRVVLPGFVPDEDLSVLYRHALCYVYPSLSEGFGLPGLEAMASGLPVACSEIEVFKEAYDDAAVYFDPFDPKKIAIAIENITTDTKLHKSLQTKGFKRAKSFSWEKTASQTLNIYQDLLS